MVMVDRIVSGVLQIKNCWLGSCSQSLQPVDLGPNRGPASRSTPLQVSARHSHIPYSSPRAV